MPNTYTQITIHAVFAVKGRANIITKEWRDELHSYLTGIIRSEKNVKSLAVGGWKDHVHILYGLPPTLAVSDLLQKVKQNSSKWINEKKFTLGKFQWQEGFGAFSHSRSQRNSVINYIMNQEEHHKNKTFREEYLDILKKFDVDYDEKYVFEFDE